MMMILFFFIFETNAERRKYFDASLSNTTKHTTHTHTRFQHIKGDDLGERKRQLLKRADCIVVLPGGLGTFDELFETACLKQLGFIEVKKVLTHWDVFLLFYIYIRSH